MSIILCHLPDRNILVMVWLSLSHNMKVFEEKVLSFVVGPRGHQWQNQWFLRGGRKKKNLKDKYHHIITSQKLVLLFSGGPHKLKQITANK